MTNDLIITYNYNNDGANDNITTSDDDHPITFTGDSLSIDWGDGSQVETYTDGSLSHDYEEIGTYTITITGNITGFSTYAFSERWGMTSITIPNTITSLSGSEFSGVDTLTSIKFTSLTPPTLENEFIQISNLETIYVPTGSLSAYQNATNYPKSGVTYVEYTPESSSQEEQGQEQGQGGNNGGNNNEEPTPLQSLYGHLKTLTKQWFYEESEMDSDYIKFSQVTGMVRNDGTIDTTSYLTASDISGLANAIDVHTVGTSGSYLDLEDIPETFTPSAHEHSTGQLINSTALDGIGTDINDSQSTINTAIDTQLGTLLSKELVVVVNSLGTASASTMNKLYLVAEATAETNDAYEIFVTVETEEDNESVYAWEKVDTTRIDLSGYALIDHTHGNITNNGKIGVDPNKIAYTTTNGLVDVKSSLGNISFDGAIGSDSGKTVVTTTNGVLTTVDSIVEIDGVIEELISYGVSLNSNNGGE